MRNLDEIETLNILNYNLLNLEMHVGKFESAPTGYRQVKGPKEKDESFRKEQGQIILEEETDIGVFEEVEAGENLERFNQRHMGGLFRTLLTQGNDIRGIQVGIVVRKDLPFEIEYRSHRNREWKDPISGSAVRVFTRDVPALILRVKGNKKPVLIVLGTHYKSKRDRDDDPESNILREGQADATVGVIEDLWAEFGEKIPVVLSGDFNGNFNKESAFANLKKAISLEDPFNLLKPAVSDRDRVTHTYHPRNEEVKWNQIDFLLVSPEIKECVKTAYVHRYKTSTGKVKPIPITYDERKENPSDHFPVMLKLDMKCLMAVWSRK